MPFLRFISYKKNIFYSGRQADTLQLGLENVGVTVNPKNGKVICQNEQTSVPNIYAVGDVVDDAPELTPVAIHAGKLLARRLFSDVTQKMNYQVC
jgi:thioredoxin reductase (NADPH)